jgi:hypothetical protein
MKKTLLLVVSLAACCGFKIANLDTGEILIDRLPSRVIVGDAFYDSPSPKTCLLARWRLVKTEDAPNPTNWIITAQNVVDLGDGTNCQLTVKTSYDPIAKAQADQIAASNAAAAYNSNCIVTFQLTQQELFKAIFQIRNYGLPTNYQVTAGAAWNIVTNIVRQRP